MCAELNCRSLLEARVDSDNNARLQDDIGIDVHAMTQNTRNRQYVRNTHL